jgi:hypothetical protein
MSNGPYVDLRAWLSNERAWQAICDGLEDAGLYNPASEVIDSVQQALVTAAEDAPQVANTP